MFNLNFILEVSNRYVWNGLFSYDLWGLFIEYCLRFLVYYKFIKVSGFMKVQRHYSKYAFKFSLLNFIANIKKSIFNKLARFLQNFEWTLLWWIFNLNVFDYQNELLFRHCYKIIASLRWIKGALVYLYGLNSKKVLQKNATTNSIFKDFILFFVAYHQFNFSQHQILSL